MDFRREDMVWIGCAFVGAAIGTFVVAPMFNAPTSFFSLLGAAIGWAVAKLVIIFVNRTAANVSEKDSAEERTQNEADFARRLFDEGSNRHD